MNNPVLPNFLEQTAAIIRTEGVKSLILKVQRHLGSRIAGEYFYDLPLIRAIIEYSNKDYSFIDIGAQRGIFTFALAGWFERCVAIEPVPEYAATLRRKISAKGLKNCETIEVALSDRTGSARLHLSGTSDGDNTLANRSGTNTSILVTTTTLDSVIDEFRVDPPYFIKIDIQGYEPHVFRGGVRSLERACAILSEFWPWGIRSAGASAWDYLKFMHEHGFVALNPSSALHNPIDYRKLRRYCILGEDSRYVTTDLLFVKRVHIARTMGG